MYLIRSPNLVVVLSSIPVNFPHVNFQIVIALLWLAVFPSLFSSSLKISLDNFGQLHLSFGTTPYPVFSVVQTTPLSLHPQLLLSPTYRCVYMSAHTQTHHCGT